MPVPERVSPPFAFGTVAHEAFEAFTRERRERLARGEPAPSREELERLLRDRWVPAEFGDPETEAAYERRVAGLLDRFCAGEVERAGETIAEEQGFTLVIDAADGTPPVSIAGYIDRIDRLPSGGIEVIDYKTGTAWPDAAERSLQLTIYALACRDALGLGTPERLTLDFTESGTRLSTVRTDEQLDAARADLLRRVIPIRAGEFGARPGRRCDWCDYAGVCAERAG